MAYTVDAVALLVSLVGSLPARADQIFAEAEAVNRLYTNDTPKSAVMVSLVQPLKKRGFVKADPG